MTDKSLVCVGSSQGQRGHRPPPNTGVVGTGAMHDPTTRPHPLMHHSSLALL